MNATTSAKKMLWREMSYVIVAVGLVLLGLYVLSDSEIQERLGKTYSWTTLAVALSALVSLAVHIRDRLFRS